jgi:hypothetical protein
VNNRRLGTAVFMALSVALTVFGYRYWAIFNYAIAEPLNDQWWDYAATIKPWVNGGDIFANFMRPHNEHIIGLQKVSTCLLIGLAGEWNQPMLMVYNAVLSSLLSGLLVLLLFLKFVRNFERIYFTVVVVLLACLPNAMETYLFGFQSAWYYYFILSIVTCYALAKATKKPCLYYVGLAVAILSCFCLGSGIINICMATIPVSLLLFETRANIRDGIKRVLPFCLAFVSVILWYGISIGIIKLSTQSSIAKKVSGIFQGYVWPLPSWALVVTLAPVIVAVVRECRKINFAGKVNFKPWHYAVVCGVLHVAAIGVGRGGVSSRHMEMVYFYTLALCWIAMLMFRASMRSSKRWIWIAWMAIILAGVVFQYASTWRRLGAWKSEWSYRCEDLYQSLQTGDRQMLSGKTFESNNLVATIIGQQPAILDDPSLRKILHCLPPNAGIVDLDLDQKVALDMKNNVAGSQSFLIWQRLESGDVITFKLLEGHGPFVKINLYGLRASNALLISVGDQGSYEKMEQKMAFGQQSEWRSVFLKTDGKPKKISMKLTGGDGWMVMQLPMRCSWIQYYFELIGRRAELIFCLGSSMIISGFIVSWRRNKGPHFAVAQIDNALKIAGEDAGSPISKSANGVQSKAS